MLTSGGIEGLDLLGKAFLDPGDAVAVEAPTYLGALMGFRSFEARIAPVRLDEGGLDVDALARALVQGLRPKLLYTIPDHQNPAGTTLARDRRLALVELARRYGFSSSRTSPTASSASTARASRACGRWRPTSSSSSAPSRRRSAPASGSAGPPARPTSSRCSSRRSRTPTSAPARSGRRSSRHTSDAASSTGTTPVRVSATAAAATS